MHTVVLGSVCSFCSRPALSSGWGSPLEDSVEVWVIPMKSQTASVELIVPAAQEPGKLSEGTGWH